jgi:serine/threonine protein phosphatase PrpC
VAGCDGVFDFISNEEVAEFVRQRKDLNQIVEVVRHKVLDVRVGSDNFTLIVVSF